MDKTTDSCAGRVADPSPMPSYHDKINGAQTNDLTAYLVSLQAPVNR
jgi:hypothetical protein